MPWRKEYGPSLSIEEKGQRAYEVSIYTVVRQEICELIHYIRYGVSFNRKDLINTSTDL